MKQTLTILMDEHRHIERACGVLSKMADKASANGGVDTPDWEKLTDFIRGFADKCHHAKEEDQLFKMMTEKGLPVEGGPIAVMLADHEEGRKFVRGMLSAIENIKGGNKNAAEELAGNARGYANLMPQHIWKEDNILYPIADSMFNENDNTELLKRFERQEHEKVGHGKHEAYLKTLAELAEKYGVKELTPLNPDQCFSCHGH